MAEANAPRNMKGGDKAENARTPRREAELRKFKDAASGEGRMPASAKIGIAAAATLLAAGVAGCESSTSGTYGDASTESDAPEQADGTGAQACDGDEVKVNEGTVLEVRPGQYVTIYSLDSGGFGVYESDESGSYLGGDSYITVGDDGRTDEFVLADGTTVSFLVCDIGVDPDGNNYARLDVRVNESGVLCPEEGSGTYTETHTMNPEIAPTTSPEDALTQHLFWDVSVDMETEDGVCTGDQVATLTREQTFIQGPPLGDEAYEDGQTTIKRMDKTCTVLGFDLEDPENPEIFVGQQAAKGTLGTNESITVGDVTLLYMGTNESGVPMFELDEGTTVGPAEENGFYVNGDTYVKALVNPDGTVTVTVYGDVMSLRTGTEVEGSGTMTVYVDINGDGETVPVEISLEGTWTASVEVFGDSMDVWHITFVRSSGTTPTEHEAVPAHPSD